MRYFSRPEVMNGDIYWMIYVRRWLRRPEFIERWNTPESCARRLAELTAG